MKQLPLLRILAVILLAVGTFSNLHAQTAYTWTVSGTGVQDGSGTWNTTNSNWWAGGAVASPGWAGTDMAVFAGGSVSGGSYTVTIGAPVSVGGIYFARNNVQYTLVGTTANYITVSGTIEDNSNNTTDNIDATLSGTGFSITGDANVGSMKLTGTCNYTGTISITNSSSNHTTSNQFGLIATDGIGLSTAANVTIIDNLSGAGTNYGLTLVTSGTFSRAIGNGADQVQILGKDSGFAPTGAPLVLNFGGAGANLIWGSASLNPAQFFLGSSGFGTASTSITLLNGIDLAGTSRQITAGTQVTNQAVILAGAIIDSSSSGAGLTIATAPGGGAGITYLTGTSIYTGTTSITGQAAGRVILGGTLTSTGASSTGTGGTGSLATSAIAISGPQFGINLTGSTTIGATISGSTGTTTTDPGNTLVLFSGTVALTGTDTYTGGTLIKSGALLQIGNGGTTGSLSANTAISGSAGAILAYDLSNSATAGNNISGGLGLSQLGTGTLTLTGSNSYTGSTTVASGTLQVGNGTTDGQLTKSGTLSNSAAVIFNTVGSQTFAGVITGAGTIQKLGAGTEILSGSSNYTGSTTVTSGTLGLGSSNALGNTPSLSVSGSGSLNLFTGTAKTVTLSGTSGVTLTLGGGALLNFGVGAGADLLQLAGAAQASVTGTVGISLSTLGGTGGTYNLLSAPGGGLLIGGTFDLLNNGGFANATLNETGTLISVTVSSIGPVIYWKGGTSNSWQTFGNFTTDATGTNVVTSSYGIGQDVVFSATGATNQNTVLGGNVSIKSLSINDTTPVTIGGTGNTLTLAGISGTTGITVGSAAGAALISANVALTGSSNVEVDGTNGLTISGTISGSNGLIKNGAGLLTLSGINNYTGGTTLNSGTLNINSDSALGDPSGAVTFSGTTAAGGTLQIAALTGTLNSARSYLLNNTGTIDTNGNTLSLSGLLSGTGTLDKIGTGNLILTNSGISYTGSTNIQQGTMTLFNPASWLGQTGTNVFNIAAGATLQITATTTQNISPTAGNGYEFTGNGTLLRSGTGIMYLHDQNVGSSILLMNMTGGTIEFGGGLTYNGGPGGNNSPNWTNNEASMQIDSGATFDIWDGNYPVAPRVDSLLGSGTLARSGYSTGVNGITIGVNNGSGTFFGIITNQEGTINLTKTGTGTQVLSGINNYAGSTTVNGGTLRVTNSNGLGFGAQTFVTQTGQQTTTVTGSATLDLAGVGTINNAITLNTGNLINSNTSVATTLDSGLSGLQFTTDPGVTGTYTVGITGGSGSGASGTAGTITPGPGNPGGNPLYVQLTAAGSGYTPGAGAPAVTVTEAGVGTVGTASAVVSSLALTGSNNSIGGAGNLTINAVVSDGASSGGFTKVGNGTLTLTASNTYSGVTNVNSGTFVVAASGSINGNLNVNSGGTVFVNGVLGGNATVAGVLDGSGVINGNTGVTVLSTGTLRGTNVTNLAFLNVTNGSVTLSSSATYLFALNSSLAFASSPWSYVNVATGSLTIGTGAILAGVDLGNGTAFQGQGPFTIAYAAGGISGTFNNLPGGPGSDITVGNNVYEVDYDGDYLNLTWENSIPEPQTWVMVVGGIGMLIGAMRMRRTYDHSSGASSLGSTSNSPVEPSGRQRKSPSSLA